MKIVYFIDHLRADGTQRMLGQLTRGLQERGHAQVVVSLNESVDLPFVKSLQAQEVTVRVIGKKILLSGVGLVKTHQWLRAEKFDVAVTLLYAADLVGRALARAARVPRLISSLRARNIHYSPLKRALTRLSMPLADVVVLNSGTGREFAIVGEGAAPHKLVVIPNGICTEDYLSPLARAALRAQWNLPSDARVLASVGRLVPQKGLDVLLRALAHVSEPNVHLILIGEGDHESKLRALAAELKIAARVHFAGYRRDVPRLLGALDVYVHPARFEGMSNAVLEAMAAGCPIVASAVDGNVELIENGVEGWLVPSDDVAELARAMNEALAQEREAHRRGRAAQERARKCFSVDAMVEQWERVLYGKTV